MFISVVAAVSYGSVKSAFQAASLLTDADVGIFPQLPLLCGEARGIEGTDFRRHTTLPKENFSDPCWYELPKFRLLYPEYNGLSDPALLSTSYAKLGIPLSEAGRKNPWTTVLTYVWIAVGVPLIMLILGAILGWALSGFKAKPGLASDRP